MNKLEELLASQPYILLDGAMGTMLMEQGLESGAPPEEWNVLHPDRVQEVHKRYIAAGSHLILTNSFGGTRFRLKLHRLQDRVKEYNKAAAINARVVADSASHTVIVGGSIGPTGELMSPLGAMSYDEAVNAFAEQAAGLAEGGVDLFWVETMSDLQEVKAAIEGARSVSDLPVVATMTFDTNGHTMMGVSPQETVEALSDLNLVAIGGNCGNGPGEIEGVISSMRQAYPDLLLVAKANAGIPHWSNDTLTYDGTPEVMAAYAVRVRDLGARLIGACCGSTPAHVRAMAAALESSSPVDAKALQPAAERDDTDLVAGRQRRQRRSRRRSK